jgi:hypothetical protein
MCRRGRRTLIRSSDSSVAASRVRHDAVRRPQSVNRHPSSACTPRDSAARRDSTLSLVHRNEGNTFWRMRGVSPRKLFRKTRKVIRALNSTAGSSDRGGRAPVAGESVHSHAVVDQIDFERRRGNRCGSLVTQRFWTISFAFPHPGWNVGKRWSATTKSLHESRARI